MLENVMELEGGRKAKEQEKLGRVKVKEVQTETSVNKECVRDDQKPMMMIPACNTKVIRVQDVSESSSDRDDDDQPKDDKLNDSWDSDDDDNDMDDDDDMMI